MRTSHKKLNRQSGIALLTTLLLLILMSSLMVGFILLVMSGQRLSGMNNESSKAFYGAEAGMEKLTADLGTLFNANYAPSAAVVTAISTAPPALGAQGISFVDQSGNPAYNINFTQVNGFPVSSFGQVTSGSSPYQGMTALATPYDLVVTARTATGAEAKLTRQIQTIGIPLFQFGIFSETDLSYFPGPDFKFGGRVHTNGDLYLASGGPAGATPANIGSNQLWLSSNVTVVGSVYRDWLANQHPINAGSEHPGSVEITNGGGFQALDFGQSSRNLLTTAPNAAWPGIVNSYNGYLRTGVKKLNLGITVLGNGAAQPIDTIRRPILGEDVANPGVLNQRYYSEASIRILLSDNPADIQNLPCTDAAKQPFDLSELAAPLITIAANPTGDPALPALVAALAANGTPLVPLAASGSGAGVGGAYTAANGYWLPNGFPIIKGFIKIEVQPFSVGGGCGTWKDVTKEILALGYAGRNIYPLGATIAPPALPALPPPSPAGPQYVEGTSSPLCAEPHPNAVIRLERIRDNPSNYLVQGICGVAGGVVPTLPTDYWPNAIFDTREGWSRLTTPPGALANSVTLGGTMNYVELDVRNLARWFAGTIGASGPSTKDPNIAPNNFVVYFSDRRGNYAPAGSVPGAWPQLSPTNRETGEYGFSDFANPASANGCPNNVLDPSEDLDGPTAGATLFTYGQNPTYIMDAGFAPPTNTGQYGTFNGLRGTALVDNPGCPVPALSAIWPGTMVANSNAARENSPLFFRRALKIVNGNKIQVPGWPVCPGGVVCGLTIAAENPAYIQGDYNSNSAGGGFGDSYVAASVAADAVTLLSNQWDDVNSFAFPFDSSFRVATNTWYRAGIIAGKGASFPLPGYPTNGSNDFGTDGGVHNFLRYIENWPTLNYHGSLLSLYYNRQAVGLFRSGGGVYSPPNRQYDFDTNFLTPALLPPRTPMFRDINTTGFSQLLLPQQ
jgi:hypothetical protein